MMSSRPSASRSATCTLAICGRSFARMGSPTDRAIRKSDGGPSGRIAFRVEGDREGSRSVAAPHPSTAAPNRKAPMIALTIKPPLREMANEVKAMAAAIGPARGAPEAPPPTAAPGRSEPVPDLQTTRW